MTFAKMQDKVNEELIKVKAKAQVDSADVPTLTAELENNRCASISYLF